MVKMKGVFSNIATGTVVNYECDPFFVSTTDIVLSECQSDGTWSSSIQCYPGLLLRTPESDFVVLMIANEFEFASPHDIFKIALR